MEAVSVSQSDLFGSASQQWAALQQRAVEIENYWQWYRELHEDASYDGHSPLQTLIFECYGSQEDVENEVYVVSCNALAYWEWHRTIELASFEDSFGSYEENQEETESASRYAAIHLQWQERSLFELGSIDSFGSVSEADSLLDVSVDYANALFDWFAESSVMLSLEQFDFGSKADVVNLLALDDEMNLVVSNWIHSVYPQEQHTRSPAKSIESERKELRPSASYSPIAKRSQMEPTSTLDFGTVLEWVQAIAVRRQSEEVAWCFAESLQTKPADPLTPRSSIVQCH
mmetsp:Transcript_44912/g.73185  ORF Transcript_44912/g.73185 Transcript_44912/m.73185 type:complete len:287 (-) Transcript_44912:317-1177(-)|eukprot:CAMPEP_0184645520 /NCGR_PEP_ID=MMETSP0308-20130426/2044_1 /TAXON_ID=38269 /ORGANISM="Gloeochaete witrockiana, Strain SAG 46.84" /LENGTH=286 /DNA_ID=CAMNT_0027074641 /DNA_START=109 /DNA_END=969 /DNA_ORIENTATION=-